MATWFKKSKRGGTTYTTYMNGNKPTTWSQSYKDGSTRTTYTHRGGNLTVTKTTRQGGYVKVERHVANKKQKPIKYKTPKQLKPRLSKPVKYKQPKIRKIKWSSAYRPRRSKHTASSIFFPIKLILIMSLFAFSPAIIDLFKSLFN